MSLYSPGGPHLQDATVFALNGGFCDSSGQVAGQQEYSNLLNIWIPRQYLERLKLRLLQIMLRVYINGSEPVYVHVYIKAPPNSRIFVVVLNELNFIHKYSAAYSFWCVALST